MHELAITESIVAAVAEKLGEARVTRVVLEVGRLAGVVPDSIRFCFDICTASTTLEGARLEIIEVPGRAVCRQCGVGLNVDSMVESCLCGSFDLKLICGEELKIKEVEVA